MIHSRVMCGGVALLILTACGGSGTPTVTDVDLQEVLGELGTTDAVTEAILGDALNAFSDTYRDEIEPSGGADPNYFDPANFRSSGTATYEGFIGIGEGDDTSLTTATVAGRLGLAVSLASNDILGEADSFIELATGDDVDGTLSIDARLNRNNPNQFGVFGDISGTLTYEDDRTSVVLGEFRGDFFGSRAVAFSGDSEGNFTTRDADGDRIGAESFAYDADIIAERTD